MRGQGYVLGVVSACSALTTHGAWAQAPPAPLEVRVLGDRDDVRPAIEGAGTLVSAEQIRRAQPTDAAEMLRSVPGLALHQEEGAALRFDVGVRGLDGTRGRRVLVLEDGVPLAVNPYAEPDLYLAPTIERARAIEIAKGSGSIAFGPQTIGGVINFLTITPPSSRLVQAEVTGGAPAFGRMLARYGDAFGGVRYLVQALHTQGAGFRNDPYRIDDVFGKIAFDTSARGELTLKLGVHDEEAVSTEVGLTHAMFLADPRRPTLAPNDHVHATRLEASLLHEQRFTPEVTLRTLAYAYTTTRLWRRQDYDRAEVAGVPYARIVGDTATPGGALFFRSSASIPDRTYDVAAVEPQLTVRVATGPLAHVIHVGARGLFEGGHRQQRETESPTSDGGAIVTDESHRSVALAGYVEDRIAFGEVVAVTPGVRVEHVAYHRDIDREPVGTAPADVALGGDSDATGVIPGIGMTAGAPWLHAFGGIHAGFAPPRIDTLVAGTGQSNHVDPERSVNHEIGARLALRRALRVEVAGFLSNFQSQILPGPDGRLVNAGQTRHLGVESSATLRLGELLRLGIVADLGGAYTFSHASFVGGPNDGNLLPYAPLHTGSASVDIEHPMGLGGRVAWSYVGAQFADDLDTVAEDATGRVGRLAAYSIVDVALRYRERRTGLTALVAVKNLLDADYIANRRPDGIFTGAFRQIGAGLRWEAR